MLIMPVHILRKFTIDALRYCIGTNARRLASIGRYVAGDGQTYVIPVNTRVEVTYFAYGSATAYTGFEGSQISCSGGALMIDGKADFPYGHVHH